MQVADPIRDVTSDEERAAITIEYRGRGLHAC
jgi:YHS domain-containing protein